MPNPRFQTILEYACLLVPALLLAWFHYDSFPDVLIGTRKLWGDQRNLPTGFDFLCRFGFLAYLPSLLTTLAGTLSLRFPVFRSALALAVCAGILGVICVLYAALLSTPAIAHGATVGLISL
jgi:hypothetical protein